MIDEMSHQAEPASVPIQRTAFPAHAQSRTGLRDRFIEAYPGIFSWMVLLAPIVLTLVYPMAGLAYLLIATGIFLIKVGWFGVGALRNYRPVEESCASNWAERLAEQPGWQDYRIILMVRAFREGNRNMLAASIQSSLDSNWPSGAGFRNVEWVYATEATDTITPPLIESLAKEFAGRIKVRQIVHPVEPEVLPGPSSAMHYVGRALYNEIVAEGGDPAKVIVADFDSDTRLHPNYLPCLLATYLTDPNSAKRVYQPAVMFTLDYWSAPIHSRIAALGTSALTLGWNRSPEIAFTGAAANLALLHSVDFWPTLSHSQDSGVEMRLRMRYGEDFTVSGLPVTTYVYPVMMFGEPKSFGEWARSFWVSFKVLFRQSARWREGPLDEFIEAVKAGRPSFSLLKLWSGIERDTLTLLPGYGFLLAKGMIQGMYPTYDVSRLDVAMPFVLSTVTVLGLFVFWRLLTNPLFVPDGRPAWRRMVEMMVFYLLMPLLLPVITAMAGLKTSTAYAFGKKPTGAYIPTPK